MNNIKVISFFVLIFLCHNLFSQKILFPSVEITGIVKDSINLHPVPYATIGLIHAIDSSFIKGTSSDESGCFKLKIDSIGSYILRIGTIGYVTKYLNLSIAGNDFPLMKIGLTPIDYSLEEVTVLESKKIYIQESDKRVYLTANDPIIQSSYADDALQNVPGVFVDFSGAISLHGIPSEIYVNGRPLKMTSYQLNNYLTQLPANRIERIEAISNPSAKYTATNTGTIINIVLKDNEEQGYLVSLGAKAFSIPTSLVWLAYDYKGEKLSFNIDGAYYYQKNKNTELMNSYSLNATDTAYSLYRKISEMHIDNDIYIDAKLNYKINHKWNLNILFISQFMNTNTSLLYEYEKHSPVSEIYSAGGSINHYEPALYTVISLEYKFNKPEQKLILESTVEYHQFHVNKEDVQSDSTDFQIFRKRIFKTGESLDPTFNISFESPFLKKYEFEAGVEYSFEKYNKNSPSDTFNFNSLQWQESDIYSEISKTYESRIAGYSTFNFKFQAFSCKLGLRYEKNSFNIVYYTPSFQINPKFSNFYPSIHIGYTSKKDYLFSISYSRRAINPDYELIPYPDRNEFEVLSMGNPDLESASINSFDISFSKNFKSIIQLDLSFYSSSSGNNIYPVNDTIYDEILKKTVLLKTYANAAHTGNSGFETNIRLQLNKKNKINLAFDIFNRSISGSYKNISFQEEGINFLARIRYQVKIKDYFFMDLSGVYNSGELSLYSQSKNLYYLNIGSRLDLFKKKLTVGMKFYDILNTKKDASIYSSPEIYIYNETSVITRMVQFSILWNIASGKVDREDAIERFIGY